MTIFNRTAIVVRPGQPFLDWLYRADPTSRELSLEDLQREPTVYLLPDCDNYEEVRQHLKQVCNEIFDQELDGWHRVPSSWPAERDLEIFDLWFEWSFHTMVIDVSHNPLLREDL
jgi:hypothetical protein